MENEYFMNVAFKESLKAFNNDEVPVGCVIVENNKIIAKGYNKRVELSDPLAHAEIIAIRKACKKKCDWRLDNCVLYSTLEPCKMCESVIKECRIKKIIYYYENKSKQMFDNTNKKEKLLYDCGYDNLLSSFFAKLRNK